MTKPTTQFQLYIAGVITVGAAVLGWVLVVHSFEVFREAPLLLWVLFACVVVGELLPINVVLRGQEGELLTSTAFAFVTMIAFGPAAAIPALAAGSIIGALARRKSLERMAFNDSQYS